jgi:betaine reductase
MDLEQQTAIKKLAEKYGPENLAVVVGFLDIELCEILAETLGKGDPSLSGPLAEVQLGLKVYNILEEKIKKNVPTDVWDEQIGLMEITVEPEKIAEINKKFKEWRDSHSSKK